MIGANRVNPPPPPPPPPPLVPHAWFKSWLVAYSAPNHYLNQFWIIVNLTFRNKLQWKCNQNTKLFIHENASENIVCETAAILSRARWVNPCNRQEIWVIHPHAVYFHTLPVIILELPPNKGLTKVRHFCVPPNCVPKGCTCGIVHTLNAFFWVV